MSASTGTAAYDPDDMNLQMITARLTQLARRRMIGKAAHEKAEAAAPERGQRAEKRAASAAKFMARRVSALAIQPQPNTNFTV
jgi:hypothetical protein